MTRKIAFRLDRSSSIKAFAPIIIESLKKGVPASLMCGPDPHNSWPHNPGYRPLPENVDFPGKDQVEFINYMDNDDLCNKAVSYGITDFFIQHFNEKTLGSALTRMREEGIRVYCLQWAADYVVTTCEALKKIDAYFVYGPAMVDIYFKLHPECNRALYEKKFVSVGSPIADSFNHIAKPDEIRKKYRLPLNKKIVLVVLLDLAYPWAKWGFGAKNSIEAIRNFIYHRNLRLVYDTFFDVKYFNVLKVLKNWCIKNNAVLVAKSRPRHREPTYIKKTTDHLLSETTNWYPIMSAELVTVADLVISFNSAVAWEAVAKGIYTITIDVRDDENTANYMIHRADSDLYNSVGVGKWLSFRDIAKFFRLHSLDEFVVDPIKKKAYIEKYLGFDDSCASERIIKYVLQS